MYDKDTDVVGGTYGQTQPMQQGPRFSPLTNLTGGGGMSSTISKVRDVPQAIRDMAINRLQEIEQLQQGCRTRVESEMVQQADLQNEADRLSRALNGLDNPVPQVSPPGMGGRPY